MKEQNKSKHTPNYLKAIMIVHGKSEKTICDFIQSNVKINRYVESKNNGRSSIQIGKSLDYVLKSRKFKTPVGFEIEFMEAIVGHENKKIVINEDFKMFIIMDTDDCTLKQKESFIDGSMFKNHWLAPYIIPIYNSPNLEEVCEKAGIKFKSKGDKRKKEYRRLFPFAGGKKESDLLKKFRDGLKQCSDTNMEVLIDFCLDLAEQNTIGKKTK